MGASAVDEAIDGRTMRPVFRMGITGLRHLPATAAWSATAIRGALDAVIADAVEALAALGDHPRARRCYAFDQGARLRCLSGLAEGADQWFAQAAIAARAGAQARGVRIELGAVLPFAAEDYRATFDGSEAAASLETYHRLIGEAGDQVLVIDGAPDPMQRSASYEAMGQMIARNCDLLVAVWDAASPPKGRGGTSDTVQFALGAGVPVWWIDASGQNPPRLLVDTLDLWRKADPGRAAPDLAAYLGAVLVPPPAPAGHDALMAYLAEPVRMNRDGWLLHSAVIGNLRRIAATPAPGSAGAAPAARARWHERHAVRMWSLVRRARFDRDAPFARQLAAAYQHRYRTSYLLVLIFGAVALGAAVIGLARPATEAVTSVIECAALFAIGGLVWHSNRRALHERYINYRLIGELARLTEQLAMMGWTLPFAKMRRAAGETEQNWVAWIAAAHARQQPIPNGAMHRALPGWKVRIFASLIDDQRAYHHRRRAECLGAATRLGHAGLALFVVTLVVALAKCLLLWAPIDAMIGTEGEALTPWLGLSTALLPAASAALFGIKAYEEFEQLAELSDRMIADMTTARKRIEDIDLDRPLASRVLGEETAFVVETLLSEVTGWAQMFRARAVEQ